MRDIVRLAKLLNDLVVAKSIYNLVKLGYSPTILYRVLRELVEYRFVRVSEYGGVKYYHLTGLGAEYLKILRKAILHRITRALEEKGIKYRIWYGDDKIRASSPIIYVEKEIELTFNSQPLVRIEVEQKRITGKTK